MPPDLWLHREGAVIGATYHDLPSFTPDALVEKEIVPSSWQCRRFRRTQSQTEIHFDQATWRMRERFLWIDTPQDSPWKPEPDPNPVIVSLVSQFLNAHPNLASPTLWFDWELSAIIPDPDQWLLDGFLLRNIPSDFQRAMVRPSVVIFKDSCEAEVNVNIGMRKRGEQDAMESVTFSCHLSNQDNLDRNGLREEPFRWPMYRGIVSDTIDFLLDKGG